ncbi:hypothetical protein BDW68DRAFT_179966 [Aspergillus falconensis]
MDLFSMSTVLLSPSIMVKVPSLVTLRPLAPNLFLLAPVEVIGMDAALMLSLGTLKDTRRHYLNAHDSTIHVHSGNEVMPDDMAPHDLGGKGLDTSKFDGPCKVHSDCNGGSFCIANWCTVARKLDDGTVVLPAREIVGEDDEYWYYKSRTAIDVLDELTGKVDAKNIGNACPKKCDGKGGTKKCCPSHFCQPPRCLGDPDDFKDHK